MNNYVVSLIRTYVPVGVGAVVAFLVARGLKLDPQVTTGVTALLTAGITAAYYAGVRALEAKFPWAGVLLGHTAKPSYGKPGASKP